MSTGPIPSYVGNQAQFSTPRPPGFDNYRPRNPPYGMPTLFMAGLDRTTSTSSPIQGSGSGMNTMGPNTQNLGPFNQGSTLTTNNQETFRQ